MSGLVLAPVDGKIARHYYTALPGETIADVEADNFFLVRASDLRMDHRIEVLGAGRSWWALLLVDQAKADNVTVKRLHYVEF